MAMEPRRAEHEQQHLVAPGKRKKTTTTANGACFCPIAAAALMTPAASSVRQALEQEVLSRAELLQSGAGDRRGERRMRNRASAERSRARRFAYMNELEAEVRVLRQENEQLKTLCDELKEAAEVQVPPVKKMTTPRLQRTSSSPF